MLFIFFFVAGLFAVALASETTVSDADNVAVRASGELADVTAQVRERIEATVQEGVTRAILGTLLLILKAVLQLLRSMWK